MRQNIFLKKGRRWRVEGGAVLFSASGLCNLGPDTLRKERDNIAQVLTILHG